MHITLLALALAQSPEPPDAEAPRESARQWAGSRLAVVPGDVPFHAHPDQTATPELVVDCTRKRPRVFLSTPFPPDSAGNYEDGWRARVQVRLDLGSVESVTVRTDREPGSLTFPRAKAFLTELLDHEEMEVRYTPFASEPTHSTFQVAALKAAMGDVRGSCGLKRAR